MADPDGGHTYESVLSTEIMITFDVCSSGVEVDVRVLFSFLFFFFIL